MVAARLLGVSFSLTLHGSDLLLDGVFLDTKLKDCGFCVTISDYNRRYILEHFPAIASGKVIVSRLGGHGPEPAESRPMAGWRAGRRLTPVAVGRLHPVEDHPSLHGA